MPECEDFARLVVFSFLELPSFSREGEDKEGTVLLFFFSFFGVTVTVLLAVDVVPKLSMAEEEMSTELRARGRPDEE